MRWDPYFIYISILRSTSSSIKTKVVPIKNALELPVDQDKVTKRDPKVDSYKYGTMEDDDTQDFVYSYRDMAAMMDTLCFVVHTSLAVLVTIFYIVWTLQGNV